MLPKNREHELCSQEWGAGIMLPQEWGEGTIPRMGSRNHSPLFPRMGSQQELCSPKSGEQELYS